MEGRSKGTEKELSGTGAHDVKPPKNKYKLLKRKKKKKRLPLLLQRTQIQLPGPTLRLTLYIAPVPRIPCLSLDAHASKYLHTQDKKICI